MKVYCKFGSYKLYKFEMFVFVKDFFIWCIEFVGDVVVYFLMFVWCSFFENKYMNLDEKMRILG